MHIGGNSAGEASTKASSLNSLRLLESLALSAITFSSRGCSTQIQDVAPGTPSASADSELMTEDGGFRNKGYLLGDLTIRESYYSGI